MNDNHENGFSIHKFADVATRNIGVVTSNWNTSSFFRQLSYGFDYTAPTF